MPKINVLPKQVAELIAAGEVVERPASVIKELVENSIDAKSTAVTVEIQHGGITYMRVTDNGCGIERADVKTAFLRHATSKVSTEDDLEKIGTLGFRGEALAAICSVSRVEMLTCVENAESGTRYALNGGQEVDFSDAGSPVGTTIIIRDLFFNTPARMKFMKTDVTESNAVAQIIDRIALSHPEISFKFIRDGKQTLSTSGDGRLDAVIYSVLGRDFAGSLVPVSNELDGVKVSGYTCKPVSCRPNRNGQYFFLNGRLVKSMTALAAVEQAYKNSAMVGKFPACVLNIEVPFGTVDVNVHPAKTEVRFSDEKRVFNCIYYAVKTALTNDVERPRMSFTPQRRFEHMTSEQFTQTVIKEEHPVSPVTNRSFTAGIVPEKEKTEMRFSDCNADNFFGEKPKNKPFVPDIEVEVEVEKEKNATPPVQEVKPEPQKTEILPQERIRYIGEAFSTYIVVEKGESIFLIDKHAAHERIIFEKLKSQVKTERQLLLASVTVTLDKREYDAVLSGLPLLEKAGFEVEDFGNGSVIVTAVPTVIKDCDIKAVISEIAEKLIETGRVSIDRIDDLYHIVSCRSAIKAGNLSSGAELLALAERVLGSDDIRYCPHGRPVAMELSRREIEKQFGRIQ